MVRGENFGVDLESDGSDKGHRHSGNGETKNDDARSVCLDDELKEIFNRLRENRKRNGKAQCRLDQWGMILGALH